MSRGVDYILDTIDSLLHGKENKKKKNQAQDNIGEAIANIKSDRIPSKPKLPDPPAYERMEVDERSDSELKESAKSELADYKAQGEKDIDAKIAAQEESYKKSIAAADAAHAQAAEKMQAEYERAKKSTDDDMLKRGLARSSIAANQKAALEAGEAEALGKLIEAHSQKVNELNDNINALAAKREEALGDFNLSYAAKLTARINELKSERDKQAAEAIKYNNALAEKEHKAQVDKQKAESDLYGEALEQKKKENELGGVSNEEYERIYSAVQSELRKLNKHDAREIVLNNPDIRANVGSYYYYLLYDEFCR